MKPWNKPLMLCLALTAALPLAAQDNPPPSLDPFAPVPAAAAPRAEPDEAEPRISGGGPPAKAGKDPFAAAPAAPEPKLKPGKPEPQAGKDPFSKLAIAPTEAKPRQAVSATKSYDKAAEFQSVPRKKIASYQTAVAVAKVEAAVPQEALLRLEMFSLTPKSARKALIEFPAATDLYTWAGQQSEKEEKDGVALERVEVIRTRSGQRSTLDSSAEFPYATEFTASPTGADSEPNKLKAPPAAETLAINAVVNAPANGTPDLSHSRIIPRSIEFRNTGLRVEAEVQLNEDGQTAYIEIAPERVRLVKEIAYDARGEIRQPVFESQKLATQCTARAGVPLFLGTFNPPAKTGVPGGTDESRTWFCFLTLTIPQ